MRPRASENIRPRVGWAKCITVLIGSARRGTTHGIVRLHNALRAHAPNSATSYRIASYNPMPATIIWPHLSNSTTTNQSFRRSDFLNEVRRDGSLPVSRSCGNQDLRESQFCQKWLQTQGGRVETRSSVTDHPPSPTACQYACCLPVTPLSNHYVARITQFCGRRHPSLAFVMGFALTQGLSWQANGLDVASGRCANHARIP